MVCSMKAAKMRAYALYMGSKHPTISFSFRDQGETYDLTEGTKGLSCLHLSHPSNETLDEAAAALSAQGSGLLYIYL